MSFAKPTHPSANRTKNDFARNEPFPLPTKTRKISKKPYKILDAPNLQDDFYLNLLDWSDKNQIAVALDSSLYLWSGCSSEITRLYETSQINDYICSVSFCDDNRIAIGNSSGQIKVFDIAKRKKLANFEGHYGRVGSLDWANGLLASGSRDGAVASWDLRSGMINRYKAHTQEICGLKWSPEGSYIASGGNDNKLVVYSQKAGAELAKFHDHKAAVKAIGWCPNNPSTLASGGGTADRHIRFFSTNTLAQSYSIDTGTFYLYTGSQICNLVFSKISNEMITTHGYSLNQINLWSSSSNWEEKSVSKVATLTGHTYRVLYLAMSPNG
jgi:cell division cycle 20-like protein 1, cofactor of APC complex